MRRKAFLLVFLAAAGCVPAGVRDTIHTFTGDTMGTTYTVKVAAEEMSGEGRAAVEKAIADELGAIDRSMSTWREDSELSKFNASTDTAPVEASPELIEVLRCAREVSAASGGAFDVTVGPLVELWGFGRSPVPDRAPSDEAIAATRALVGYEKLEIDPAAGTIRKAVSGLRVDVGALAPGYGSDRIARALERLGYRNYMVELGGEVRTGGRKLDGQAWNIAIERPDVSGRDVYRALPLVDESLSTSGDYRDYYERDGVRYSHTIDPRTGRPIAHNLASISVIHKDCMSADAWATALDVLGPEEGLRLAREQGIPALFLVRESPGSFREVATPEFEARLRAGATDTTSPAGAASGPAGR